jgi:hypothetical protein
MTEQLFATETRFFAETSPGNATPSGDVIETPLSNALVSRVSPVVEDKTSPFRHKLGREPLIEFFSVQATLPGSPAILAFLLEPHLRGGTELDWRSPLPTFALQVESEDGDLIQFAGLAVKDLQVSFVARGVATLNVTLFGFTRTTGIALEAVTAEIDSEPLPGTDAIVAVNTGALDPFAWASNKVDARTAEFYLRRDLEVAQYDADGVPSRHNAGPFRVFGEVVLPADAFTETATGSFVDGSAAFFLGPIGANLQLVLDDSVRWLSSTDPVKADDFRDYRVLFEAEANASGSILSLTNNL